MILDVLLWLPVKVLSHFGQPVIAMLESLNEADDPFSGMGNEEIDAYFEERSL